MSHIYTATVLDVIVMDKPRMGRATPVSILYLKDPIKIALPLLAAIFLNPDSIKAKICHTCQRKRSPLLTSFH